MAKAPEVPCPQEGGKKVPIYHCIGSFVQQKEACPNLIQAVIEKGAKRASVKCKLQGRRTA